MQAAIMQIIYKGICQWFLKLIVGVQFTDCRFLKKEKQFIILANHNSHLDTLSLLSSLPGKLLWKVKPVAAVNPEKPDVPLNKNDAFQKVQKRRVQEKR